jgi:hypothetical protein
MSSPARARIVLLVVLVVIVTALILNCGRERPEARASRETGTHDATKQSKGKAPLIPQVGPLTKPRSLEQVGVPAELTRK